jgi:hypothetical protein
MSRKTPKGTKAKAQTEDDDDVSQYENRLAKLEKAFIELKLQQRKLIRRKLRFDCNEPMSFVINPVEWSLKYLKERGYCTCDEEDDVYEDESKPVEDPTVLRQELNAELDTIQSEIAFAYSFKVPSQAYEDTITLEKFIELSEARLEGDTLHMKENVIVLNPTSKKASLSLGTCVLRFAYYNEQWLVSAD